MEQYARISNDLYIERVIGFLRAVSYFVQVTWPHIKRVEVNVYVNGGVKVS